MKKARGHKVCDKCNSLYGSSVIARHTAKCKGVKSLYQYYRDKDHLKQNGGVRKPWKSPTSSYAVNKHRVAEIQAFYDDAHTMYETLAYFNMTENAWRRYRDEGLLLVRAGIETSRARGSDSKTSYIKDPSKRIKHSLAMQTAVAKHPESFSANNVCGRVKIVEYNGVKLHGQWELTVAKWLDNQDVKWDRKTHSFEYLLNGNKHTYFPEFYLPDFNCYIEVKGYERDKDKAKWAVISNLKVLKKMEIEQIRKGIMPLVSDWNLSSDRHIF